MNFIEMLYKLDQFLRNSKWEEAIATYDSMATELKNMHPVFAEAVKTSKSEGELDYRTYPYRQADAIYNIAYDLMETYRWGNPNEMRKESANEQL